MARLVRELNRSPVLDVGAAQGIMGVLLRDTGLELDAIEPHPQWAESARAVYRNVFDRTIECADDVPDGMYPVIVCGDVLEHVVDPVAALEKLKRMATPDARFIISIPNVAHVAVRFMLLLGFFPRMQRGILDKTHLHFFTRRTASQMLGEAGLRVERTSATPVPLDELWRGGEGTILFKLLMGIQHGFVRMLPTLFGYQWIFVARRADERR
jgi:2-polyprenyl-3-methyl-5-hydroxy-6-metoxy-1,4-benzoquinol methylase